MGSQRMVFVRWLLRYLAIRWPAGAAMQVLIWWLLLSLWAPGPPSQRISVSLSVSGQNYVGGVFLCVGKAEWAAPTATTTTTVPPTLTLGFKFLATTGPPLLWACRSRALLGGLVGHDSLTCVPCISFSIPVREIRT